MFWSRRHRRKLGCRPHYSTLFLACHGTVDPGTFDGLASSRLALWDGERLTARDVFFELNGRLRADLVFLNACASGRFNRGSRPRRADSGRHSCGRARGRSLRL